MGYRERRTQANVAYEMRETLEGDGNHRAEQYVLRSYRANRWNHED
jgi:hypothetical protein